MPFSRSVFRFRRSPTVLCIMLLDLFFRQATKVTWWFWSNHLIWFSDFLPISVIPFYCTVPLFAAAVFAVFFPSFRVASFFFLFLCGNCLFFLFFSLSFFPLRSAFSASSTFAPLSIIQLSFSLRSLSLFSSPSFCFHLHCIRYSLGQWWRRPACANFLFYFLFGGANFFVVLTFFFFVLSA